MPGFFNALFGASDLNLVTDILGPGDLNLGSGFQFQVLQLFSILTDHKTVVFFGDSN